MQESSNNKTIAKNTVFLYIRMMVTMIVSLYTSRVILQILGVDDYGIYSAVGGIVGLLSFINSSLSTGTSRFITYGIGEGNMEKLKQVFSTTLTGHIIIAALVVLLAETLGLWFFYHKMEIPVERLNAAEYVFHLSIITAFFSVTQIPFNACIIAHERMTIFAYVSIIDAFARLAIVYLLSLGSIDKLVLYAFLLCLLQVAEILFYRYYCTKYFEEVNLKLHIDKTLFKEIIGFSGWSLLSQASIALNSQGILILLNMFFAPAVVTARTLSIQVNMAANQFMTNFQTAAVPQIVKRFASKDYEGSKYLLLQTTKYSYFLMLLLSLPIFLSADILLQLWLGGVPEYTSIFLRLIVVQSLFQVFDSTFYYALYAKGRLRENALLSPTISLLSFPIVYLLFKCGCSPVALSWAGIIVYAIIGLIIKPILVVKIVDYSWKDVWSVFSPCLKVTLLSVPVPLLFFFYVNNGSLNLIAEFLILVLISVLSVAISSWFVGISYEHRRIIIKTIKQKLL